MQLIIKLLLCIAIMPLAQVGAEEYKVKTVDKKAPSDTPKPIGELMQSKGLQVISESGKTLCTYWFRKVVPLDKNFKEDFDLKYAIESGTLVGIVKYESRGKDFRGQYIRAGLYTLRYNRQPIDGNHLDTAPFRDFFMVLPIDLDNKPELLDPEKAVNVSKKAVRATHPGILLMQPPKKDRKKFPDIHHNSSENLHIVAFQTLGSREGSNKPIAIEFVAVGHAIE